MTLSRPAFAAVPSSRPSCTPGLLPGGVPAAQDRTISAVVRRKAVRSSPIAAAGTRPKLDSTEYRPPMAGSPMNTCRNPSASATFCILEPGSVTATKCEPALSPTACFMRSQK